MTAQVPVLVPVLVAPLLDPGAGRVSLTLPEGLSLRGIAEQAFPGLSDGDMANLRIYLSSPMGAVQIAPQYWSCTRPRAGVQVIVRMVPGDDALRSILTAIVSIAALALAPALAGFLGLGTSQLAISLVAAGLSVVGTLLINALIPVAKPDNERRTTYAISGWKNAARPDQPVPLVLGRHRYAPPFAATSYTEIVDDQQYVRALFCFGYGRLALSDFRLGETSLADYNDVSIEVREGVTADLPMSLYPHQVIEDAASVELTRPLPRDDAGEIIDGGASIETPIRRFTAGDSESAAVILGFPGGLFGVNSNGKLTRQTVTIRIRQRLVGAVDWIDVASLDIQAKTRSAFSRQHSWVLPGRGRWQIEVTRMTDETTATDLSDRSYLSAVQSIRPEYPINMDKPLTLVALRIRATYQLNGGLDDFNALAERYGRTWDGNAWTDALSRNPASAYLTALEGPSNPYPATDAEIDLEQIADWYEFCAARGLSYDFVHEADESLSEMLTKICGAGRATPRHDGLRWGVVIDRPDTLVVDELNTRNSANFGWSRQYFDPPDAFRVRFLDETNDYNPAERIVPWPGHAGEVVLTETLELPGKTNPDEVWIEARRRMHELTWRPDTFHATQDGAVRVATRGDLVVGSFDVINRTQVAARVKQVAGDLITLDEEVLVEADTAYGIRFRGGVSAEDTRGTSHVVRVAAAAGQTSLLRLTNGTVMPQVGGLIHFGEVGAESMALRVRGVEGGTDFAAVFDLVAAAPEIDALTDAEVPPAWDGRVGAVVSLDVLVPAAPRFTFVGSPDDPDTLSVLLAQGTGSAAVVTTFEIDHSPAGAGTWTTVSVPVANGGTTIAAYLRDVAVDLRARAIASDGTPGPYTATLAVIVGSDNAPIPAALGETAVVIDAALGHATVTVATGIDAATVKLQVYRAPTGVALNRAIHAIGAPIASVPSSTVSYVDGDATRVNLLVNGDFATATVWTPGANWAIAGGLADHAPGAADAISQTLSLTSGKFYRTGFTVSGRTAGQVQPALYGGSDRLGIAVTADGLHADRIQAVTGNASFGFSASATFDGAVDDVVLFLETDTCIAAGDYDYYVEPQNSDNVPGPVAGPFFARII